MRMLIILLFLFYFITGLRGDWANTNWAKLKKKIAIQYSTNISAWLDRGFVTNLTPVGDGTYVVKLYLTPGETYNFIFFAETDDNPPPGLNPNTTYYDQVPTSGWIPVSTNSNATVIFTNYAWYDGIGTSKDARRVIKVPEVSDGQAVWVFNNFSDAPKPPDSVEAIPGNGEIILNWTPAKGQWNMEEVNVLAGGSYLIYVSNDPATNFAFVTNLPSNVTSFTHRGLTNGYTYYYVIVASDAYTGSEGTVFENKKSELPPPDGKAEYQAFATPNSTIPVYFKVEKINWEVVKQKKYLVWLTPAQFDGRFFPWKTPGRIVKCVLKKN